MQKTENKKTVYPKISAIWVDEGDLAKYPDPAAYNKLLDAYAKGFKYERPLTSRGGNYISSEIEDNVLVQKSKDPRMGTEGFIAGTNNYKINVQTDAGDIISFYIKPKFSAQELELQAKQFQTCLKDQRA